VQYFIVVIWVLTYFLSYLVILMSLTKKHVDIDERAKKVVLIALFLSGVETIRGLYNINFPLDGFYIVGIASYLIMRLLDLKVLDSIVYMAISKVATEVIVLFGLVVLWTFGLAPK